MAPTTGLIRHIADRSAETLPLAPLPDYHGWAGRTVPAARAVSGSLVRAGLAEPDSMSAEDYLVSVRALWVVRT